MLIVLPIHPAHAVRLKICSVLCGPTNITINFVTSVVSDTVKNFFVTPFGYDKGRRRNCLSQHGFNCTQSILSVFATDFGLDRNFAARISQGFGAGIGRSDEICGSLSGAIVVIGLRYGGLAPDDSAAKEKTYTMVGELVKKFKPLHSSVACTDLLGYNLSDPQQYADAKAHQVAKKKCPAFIRDAVELVESLI